MTTLSLPNTIYQPPNAMQALHREIFGQSHHPNLITMTSPPMLPIGDTQESSIVDFIPGFKTIPSSPPLPPMEIHYHDIPMVAQVAPLPQGDISFLSDIDQFISELDEFEQDNLGLLSDSDIEVEISPNANDSEPPMNNSTEEEKSPTFDNSEPPTELNHSTEEAAEIDQKNHGSQPNN